MFKNLRHRLMCFVIIVICLTLSPIGFASYGFGDFNNSAYSTILLDKENLKTIEFDTNDIKMLPLEAQKFIQDNKYNIVAANATIHIIKSSEDSIPMVISSKKYDFSNPEEIKMFKKDKTALDSNFSSGIKNFDIIEPLSEDDHGGYIITGINASYISGTHRNHFQLHGYWDWQTQLLVSKYDKIGLGWTNGFSSDESSHRIYGNRYYDGASISFKKLPYNHKERFNKGVIWTHLSDYRSEGAALAQIYDNSLSDQYIGIWFEYVATQGPTSDDGWWVDVADTIFSYYGVPYSGAYYYDSFESVYCP